MISLLFAQVAIAAPPAGARPTNDRPAMRVSIDNEGRCQILKSSGDPQQDEKTCEIVKACAAKSANLKEALAKCDTAPLARKREN